MNDALDPEAAGEMPDDLLVIEDLVVEYPNRASRRHPFRALHEVNLRIAAGETLGLVGESGSGKSTIGRAVLGLAPIAGGDIRFDGRSITRLRPRARRELSRDIQVVFQDPYTSLNPAMTVNDILTEPLLVTGTSKADAQRRVRELAGRGAPALQRREAATRGNSPAANGSGSPSPERCAGSRD